MTTIRVDALATGTVALLVAIAWLGYLVGYPFYAPPTLGGILAKAVLYGTPVLLAVTGYAMARGAVTQEGK